MGVTEIWVSLTHSATTAGAVVVLEADGSLNSVRGND
jgi:phosphopantetheinyl transferase (holo-ACP synthase)